ncbi:hypothetical protein MLD38_010579 [Melastoma candidum]|uniref:Uncharacterized protein n=1 Tax=Melastoma candidum TaxID=119954 RepID=A0ACB9R8M8_9MYRT|nr:hypothetical protein MLD38_010579 [Melastoma candidum]
MFSPQFKDLLVTWAVSSFAASSFLLSTYLGKYYCIYPLSDLIFKWGSLDNLGYSDNLKDYLVTVAY